MCNNDQHEEVRQMLQTRYEIAECVQWINRYSFKRVALQFAPSDLQDSPVMVKELMKQTSPDNEYFIVLTASCGVDFLAPLRLGPDYVQAIILFGSNTGSPCLTPDTPFAKLPVLFVFGNRVPQDQFDFVAQRVKDAIQSQDVIFYDLQNIVIVKKLIDDGIIDAERVAKISKLSDMWHFPSQISALIDENSNVNICGPFSCPSGSNVCKSVVWIGSCENLFFRTIGWNIRGIDPNSQSEWCCVMQRELTKRLALIERAKSAKTIGIVFTNTLPSVDATLERVKTLIAKKGKKMVLISIVQSADETKFGNFPEVDVYALSSACSCGSLILKTKAHVPLISLTELEISLGVKRLYGGLEWNSDADQMVEADEVEDGTSENEIRDILEFKEGMRSNWYGLDVAAGETAIAIAEEGLSGIASSYASEPEPR